MPKMEFKEWPCKGKGGGPRMYDHETLIAKCHQYLEWCWNNPLKVPRTGFSAATGKVTNYTEQVPRSPTMGGFYKFLGVSDVYLRQRPEQLETREQIKRLISDAQTAGGLSRIFDPTLVSRVVGLAEKTEVVHSVQAPRPDERHVANLVHPDCTDEQLDAIYAAGREPMLYSQAQLEAGMPFVMPDLPPVAKEPEPIAGRWVEIPEPKAPLPKPWER